MIIRIFRVEIFEEFRKEFERDFISESVEAVKHAKGFISFEIGFPTKWHPHEYTMISKWEDEKSLIDFAGENWNTAVIPENMKRYAKAHHVHHFRNFPMSA
jgi:heme oxygenase (mycobilin-producing)